MTIAILWLGRTIPLPLDAGDRVYSAQLIGAVARTGARVAFLGLNSPDSSRSELKGLEPSVQWQIVPGQPRYRVLALMSSLPMVGARFATNQYRQAIACELATNTYDAVVFDQYGLGWALADVQRLAGNKPVLVHLSHDFETEVTAEIARNFTGNGLRKMLLRQNARKTRAIEQRLAHGCNLLVALTEHDSAAFFAINPALQRIVIPPGYCGPKLRSRTINKNMPRRAIIVGSFSWTAKQMNLRRFLEAASGPFTRHGIELHVVGLVPKDFRAYLCARFPWIVFCGFVDDLNQELQNARIALVPEETGGGFKLKTLDYIFRRVPVAAIESALNGIPDRLKSQFALAHDLQTLVSRVIETIDDTKRLNDMQNRAYTLAENAFSWEINGRQFVAAIESAATAQRGRGPKHSNRSHVSVVRPAELAADGLQGDSWNGVLRKAF